MGIIVLFMLTNILYLLPGMAQGTNGKAEEKEEMRMDCGRSERRQSFTSFQKCIIGVLL